MNGLESFKEMIKPGEAMDIKKSLNKLWIGVIASVIITAIAYGVTELQTISIDPKYTFLVGLGIAILYGVQNAVKHWHDQETSE